jgi:hypothetical protein
MKLKVVVGATSTRKVEEKKRGERFSGRGKGKEVDRKKGKKKKCIVRRKMEIFGK